MCCFHTAVNEEEWILYKYIVLLNLNKKENTGSKPGCVTANIGGNLNCIGYKDGEGNVPGHKNAQLKAYT